MANATKPKRLRFRGEDSFICKNRGGRKKTYKLYIGAAGEVQRVEIASDVLPTDSQDGPTLNPPALPAYDMPPTPIIPADPRPDNTGSLTLVSFPDWDKLTCDGVQIGIQDLQTTLMTSRFSDPAIRTEYERQIEMGKSIYFKKCALPPPTPVLRNPFPIVGGPTRGSGTEKKEEKKPFPWLLIVIGGTVLYLLTKSNK